MATLRLFQASRQCRPVVFLYFGPLQAQPLPYVTKIHLVSLGLLVNFHQPEHEYSYCLELMHIDHPLQAYPVVLSHSLVWHLFPPSSAAFLIVVYLHTCYQPLPSSFLVFQKGPPFFYLKALEN